MAVSAAKYVALVLLMALGSLGAEQQTRSGRPVEEFPLPKSPRLISLDEGMAIIGAALQVRYRSHPREDCSHFVHDIYKKAGFLTDMPTRGTCMKGLTPSARSRIRSLGLSSLEGACSDCGQSSPAHVFQFNASWATS